MLSKWRSWEIDAADTLKRDDIDGIKHREGKDDGGRQT